MSDLDASLSGRLRWRCRRGMKELDVLLERYLEQRYAHATAAERAALEALLESPDPLIHAWCMGRATPPTESLRALIGVLTAGPGCTPSPGTAR